MDAETRPVIVRGSFAFHSGCPSATSRAAAFDDLGGRGVVELGGLEGGRLGLAQALGDLDEAALDAAEDAAGREAARGVTLAGGHAGEDLDALGHVLDAVEV